MIVRVVLIVVLLAAGARSAFQGWASYRRHRVGVSIYLNDVITREAQPRVYWSAMLFLGLLVAGFMGGAVALAIGLIRHSS